VRKLI